jgi:hypothetical protein
MNTIAIAWKKEKSDEIEVVNKKTGPQNRPAPKVKLFYKK